MREEGKERNLGKVSGKGVGEERRRVRECKQNDPL